MKSGKKRDNSDENGKDGNSGKVAGGGTKWMKLWYKVYTS
jgi:hypothetical protein